MLLKYGKKYDKVNEHIIKGGVFLTSKDNVDDNCKNNLKKCFVITPIGPNGSPIRRKIDGVIECAIRPALENKYEVIVSHEEKNSGSIKSNIIKNIYECDLVIANLTTQNPNVMYEVALRHAVAKPIIHITENLDDLHFDINDHRTIEYRDDMKGVIELREQIISLLSSIENSNERISNPIVDSLGKTNVIEIPENNIKLDVAISNILESIKALNERISSFEKYNKNSDYYYNRINAQVKNLGNDYGNTEVINISSTDKINALNKKLTEFGNIALTNAGI